MVKLLVAALVLVAIGMVCVEANNDEGSDGTDITGTGTEDFVEKNEDCFDGFECPVGYFPYNFDGIQGCTRETKNLCDEGEYFTIEDGRFFCGREVTVADLCDSLAQNFYFFDGIYGCSTGSP